MTSLDPLESMMTGFAGSVTVVSNSNASELPATASDSNASSDRCSGLNSVGCPVIIPDWNESPVFMPSAPRQILNHDLERDPLEFPSLTALPNWRHRADVGWDLVLRLYRRWIQPSFILTLGYDEGLGRVQAVAVYKYESGSISEHGQQRIFENVIVLKTIDPGDTEDSIRMDLLKSYRLLMHGYRFDSSEVKAARQDCDDCAKWIKEAKLKDEERAERADSDEEAAEAGTSPDSGQAGWLGRHWFQ